MAEGLMVEGFRPIIRRGVTMVTHVFMRFTIRLLACVVVIGTVATDASVGQEKPAESIGSDLEILQVRPDFYMIAGAGANIGVQIGQDGVIVVDTGTAVGSERVLAEIRKLTPRPIRYVINTSADADHVGGNERLSAAGQSIIPTGGLNEIGAFGGRAPIVAEEQVLARMGAPHGQEGAFPPGALPTHTYSADLERQKDIYLNGQAVQIIHQPAAHSDGDSIVFFRRSDVVVTGDVLDTTRFPVIDLDKGGSIQGVIDSLNRIIGITVPPVPLSWQDGGTTVVPGHGRLCEEAEVVDYRDMLTIIRDRIQDSIKKELSLEQIQKTNPTQGYRRRYGSDSGTWTTQMFVEAVYRSLAPKGDSRP
jgi:glyoxylase-like metal-dependent hydrolase (beta-lactamase superfamily II)